eukprot:5663906-Prorocentrum_lima.AAC.1
MRAVWALRVDRALKKAAGPKYVCASGPASSSGPAPELEPAPEPAPELEPASKPAPELEPASEPESAPEPSTAQAGAVRACGGECVAVAGDARVPRPEPAVGLLVEA